MTITILHLQHCKHFSININHTFFQSVFFLLLKCCIKHHNLVATVVLRYSDSLRFLRTFNGGALGQYGDRPHCHVLELVDGAALAPPAVRPNPQEMAHLIGPLGGVENSPAETFVVNLKEGAREACGCVPSSNY